VVFDGSLVAASSRRRRALQRAITGLKRYCVGRPRRQWPKQLGTRLGILEQRALPFGSQIRTPVFLSPVTGLSFPKRFYYRPLCCSGPDGNDSVRVFALVFLPRAAVALTHWRSNADAVWPLIRKLMDNPSIGDGHSRRLAASLRRSARDVTAPGAIGCVHPLSLPVRELSNASCGLPGGLSWLSLGLSTYPIRSLCRTDVGEGSVPSQLL
jgi:hypothetical protein